MPGLSRKRSLSKGIMTVTDWLVTDFVYSNKNLKKTFIYPLQGGLFFI